MLQAWHICIWGFFSHSSLQILNLCRVRWGALVHRDLQVSPEMFDRALAGPLKDIHRVVSHSCVDLAVCLRSLSCWRVNLSEVLSALEEDLAVLFSIHLSLDPDLSPSSCRLKKSPQHEVAITMLYHRDGIGQVMSGACFRPDVTLAIQDKEFNLVLIWPEMVRFLMVWESFGCLLANTKRAVMCLVLRSGFRLPLFHKGLVGGVLQRGCPSGRFSHLHRGTLELCQSDHWVLGHLPDQYPSLPECSFWPGGQL